MSTQSPVQQKQQDRIPVSISGEAEDVGRKLQHVLCSSQIRDMLPAFSREYAADAPGSMRSGAFEEPSK